MKYAFSPIPGIPPPTGWEGVKIIECGERVISVEGVHPRIIVSPFYYEQGLMGSINGCFLRERVVDMLVSAIDFLPQGYKFVVFDGWRPKFVQQKLFDNYCLQLKSEFPQYSEDEIIDLAVKYVSVPTDSSLSPAPHSTGGSVDLSIVDGYGNLLNMGSEFDSFSASSNTVFFESDDIQFKKSINVDEVRENRRLLYWSLISVGFTNYFTEWWHYDYGNQFWAKQCVKQAVYGKTSLLSGEIEYE